MSSPGRAPRVVWFSPYPTPYKLAFWEALADGCSLTVWCYSAGVRRHPWDLRYPSGLDVRVAPTSSLLVRGGDTEPFFWLHDLGGLLGGEEPDVVVVSNWNHPATWQAARWALRNGVEVLLTYESTLRSHTRRRGVVPRLRRRFMRMVDHVYVPSEGSAESVLADGVPEERIIVGDNVVDVGYFRRPADLPSEDRSHRFVCVAQLIPRKNQTALLEAFASVRQEGEELWLVGDGPDRPEMEAHVGRLGLAEAVTIHGHQPPECVRDLLWRSDTLVLPSSREVWGLVVNEALAAGLHVVVSEEAGVAESIREDGGVFIVAPRPPELARGMAASRDAWRGPVPDPSMLARTPAAAAQAMLEGLR